MTLAELVARLERAGIDSAQHDARELFRAFSGMGGGYLPMSAESSSPELIAAAERRERREPLQYIVGEVGFYREEYLVNEAVLIPRADTEHLVDYAVKHIPSGERFADLCTGSGCVAISTLKNTKDTRAIAIDISREALSVALKNAEKNGVADRLTLIESDVLGKIDIPDGSLFAVLSNPPYVSDSAYEALEPEIYKEPKCAFIGGEDGGDFYRAIVPAAKKMIKPEGFIALEIGYDQRELLILIGKENGLLTEIIRDYSDNDRVAVLRFPEA